MEVTAAIFETASNAHAEILEAKLIEVLAKHDAQLGVDGVDLIVITPPINETTKTIPIIYELRRKNELLETFGWEFDLTTPV